jgi:pimeloyl-ACP methyl ester carboxylesterase
MAFDPVAQDLPTADPQYPTTNATLVFTSAGTTVYGRIFVAQGSGPHPTILLLHGFPGTEQNFDLAHVFRRVGWNAAIFHYRGAWGSGGDYSFTHVLEDVQNAIAYLREAETAQRYRIDPRRLVLVGHSLGGFAALQASAADGNILAVASLAGFNLGGFGKILAANAALTEQAVRDWDEEAEPLHGTSGEALIQEIITRRDEFDLPDRVGSLAPRPVCLVAGSRDTVSSIEMHHAPLVDALRTHPRLTQHVLDADHGFSDKRVALARLLVDWLNSL